MPGKRPSIGSMNKVAVFKVNNRGSLGLGKGDGYVQFYTAHCSLEKKAHRKVDDRKQVIVFYTYIMKCRYDETLLTSLSGSVLITIAGVDYTVLGFDLIDERTRYYEFELAKFNL